MRNFKGQSSGGISYFKINGTKLSLIMSSFFSGLCPCHIKVNSSRNVAYVTNYDSGHFAVLKLKDWRPVGGAYIESYDNGSGVNAKRQEASHPHGAYFYDKFVYVVDLGADKIWHYKHDNGRFDKTEPSFTATPPGSGPRHMAISEKEKLAFLLTELSNELIVYRIDEVSGALSILSLNTILPEDLTGENYASEIYIHPNGKFLYHTNRVNGLVIVHEIIDPAKGVLRHIQNFKTIGTWPRHFNIHSSGKILLCADQFKDELEVLSIDESSGKLSRLQTVPCNNKPACIVFNDEK